MYVCNDKSNYTCNQTNFNLENISRILITEKNIAKRVFSLKVIMLIQSGGMALDRIASNQSVLK